jgi:hypothetical protein
MPTVKEMKDQMTNEVREAAKRCDIMVGSVTSWPMSAMSAFLDACARLKRARRRTCEWIPIEDDSDVYNTCEEGEEWHVPEGSEPFPFCHWCGGRIKVVEFSESEGAGR